MDKKTQMPRKASGNSRGRPKNSTNKPTISKEEFLSAVEKRAYEIFEERLRNNQGGNDLADWIKAEEEMRHHFHLE